MIDQIKVDKIKKWVEIVSYQDDEIKEYSRQIGIPSDFISGVNDPFEIARIEELRDQKGQLLTLVLLQYIVPVTGQHDYREYKTNAIAIIQKDDMVITALREVPEMFIDLFSDFKASRDYSYEEMVMRIFWKIQCECVNVLRWIHEEVEDMQGDIEHSSQNQELYRLMSLDKSLARIKTAIQNNRNVLEQLTKKERFQDLPSLNSLMHDILIESYQAESMADEGMQIIDQLSDIFSNVISNNLNNIMKVLTSITIVLTIPTIIGGVWGMNVPVPFEHNEWGFAITVILTVVISVVVLIWLKKKGYL
ncbi:magnesium transporter CorA family protein [Facklamia lactis]|uniref:magnesium transporter CorA family protein n=1 Tax=Facklamia lactis TaxID=2749967 RepID=UPI0018CD93C1|nr:magnesium transporter CorA family protein [Facklamia lactis]MBG9980347.1 magnesium transporter CorA family protein [Facklamia lactis]